jgi:hypothetical protein
MKTFREQRLACKETGYTGEGPKLSYDKYPELLPQNPRIRNMILAGENAMPTFSCLRFGGICNSGKPQCRTLRGLQADRHGIDAMAKYES